MGEMHGKGKFLKGDGYYYEGEWDAEKAHGTGKMMFDDGNYEGDDLTEDNILSSYMEKYLARNEKQLVSVQKKLISNLKSKIPTDSYQKYLLNHDLVKDDPFDSLTLEEDIISICYRSECQEKTKHRCSRCVSVSYCGKFCADLNWNTHKEECDQISEILDNSIDNAGRRKTKKIKKAFDPAPASWI